MENKNKTMTKEEQLKIYSAYLPYELQCEYEFNSIITKYSEKRIGKLLGVREQPFHSVSLLVDNKPNNPDYIKHSEVKPILYSMNFLTKEIEHKGERFIPMIYFIKKTSLFDLAKCTFEVYEYDGEIYVNAHDGDRVIDSIYYDGNIFWSSKLLDIHEGYRPANLQHIWQEMLFELNFNVFGLDESEYINKATLKTK